MPWTVTRYDDRYAPWSVLTKPAAGLPTTHREQPTVGDFADNEAGEDTAAGPDLTLYRDAVDPGEGAAAPE